MHSVFFINNKSVKTENSQQYMSFSTIIQSSYSATYIGLYQDSRCITIMSCIDPASTFLIPTLDELFKKNNITLNTISFIGAYQGPGPFTAIRVILASINGIAFAQNIPLVGVDGLDALLEENTNEKFPTTITLFNAYNNDAYFGIQHNGKIIHKGYKNILQLLAQIQKEFPKQKIRFIGQGVEIFKDQIKAQLHHNAHFPFDIPKEPSLDIIAQKAYKQWQQGKVENKLLPLYLKTMKYKKSIT